MPSETALTRHLRAILEHQGQGLVGRERALRLSLLAALSGHNVLLLGPPGTAKSMVARRLAGAFGGASRFEYLLTRFTTPDELFGPVSIQALKQDRLVRNTQGYLPQAEVVFLDEIFKAGSAILNALLTLLNERLFFNGGAAEKVPLLVLIAASNEVPEGGELQALYDRFPLRLLVEPVQGERDFESLLRAGGSPEPLPESAQLSVRDLTLLRGAAGQVDLSAGAFSVLSALRTELSSGPAEQWQRRYVSDRRWTQIVDMLRTSASVHGHPKVSEVDCGLLRYCLWNAPEDAPAVGELVDKVLQAQGMELELDAGGVGVRWRKLLDAMCLHDQALSARVERYELRVGPLAGVGDKRRYSYSPSELAEQQQNTWDAVLRSGGLYWDGQDFRQLQSSGRQGYVMGDWAVSSERIWLQVQGHQAPQFEDSVVVELRAVRGRGAVVELAQVPGPVRTRWLGQVGVIRGTLEAQEELRATRLRALEASLAGHLFLQRSDVAGLVLGLEQAGLEIETWRARLEELEEALMNGSSWSSPELPLPA